MSALQTDPGEKPEQQIRRFYKVLFQRAPSPQELQAGLEYIKVSATAPAADPPKTPPSPWSYGYAAWDEKTKTLGSFTALPYFTGDAWQGGPSWPDPTLGWVQLTAEGGHAGNDLDHAAVRRWTAPEKGTVTISANIRHEETAGDGIRAHIIVNHTNVLVSWTLHNKKQDFKFDDVSLNKGDTIDFVVDLHQGLNSDMFKSSEEIKYLRSETPLAWNAKKDFGGPTTPKKPLDAWEKYAQVLLLSNEFMFVD